jgi:hypothetical protein
MDIVLMEMCKSIDGPMTIEWKGNTDTYTIHNLFSERHYPTCTCPAYHFGKRVVNFGGRMVPEICRHIEEAQDSVCGWHNQYSPEPLETTGVCPRCGGPTVVVGVAV